MALPGRLQAFLKSITRSIIFSALLVYLLMSTVFAQGIVSEENGWNVYATGYPGFIGTETYKIQGDSLLDGKDYKIIWMTYDSLGINWSYQGLLREDSNKVFFIPPGSTEGLLYDFNLQAGDTTWVKNMFCFDNEVEVVINGIDTVEYYGKLRKRWLIDYEYGMEEYWIEGIGSSLGPLHSKYYMCIVCPTWDLLCFHKGDTLLYSMTPSEICYVTSVGIKELIPAESINIFPNPARDKFEVRSVEFEVECVEIYNADGQKIFAEENVGSKNIAIDVSQFKAGIYLCRIRLDGHVIVRKLIKQ